MTTQIGTPPDRTVSPDETVHAIVARHPETHAVFEGLGVHVCCGGDVPLAAAAERDGVDLDRLLYAVEAAIRSA